MTLVPEVEVNEPVIVQFAPRVTVVPANETEPVKVTPGVRAQAALMVRVPVPAIVIAAEKITFPETNNTLAAVKVKVEA